MSEQFRFEAAEWLKDEDHWLECGEGPDYGYTLVEDLYQVGTPKVEVGVVRGKSEDYPEADTLYVTLSGDYRKAVEVMTLIASQHANEVDIVKGEENVVRVWWD